MNVRSQIMCLHDGDAFEVSNQVESGMRSPASWFYDWATGGLGRSDAGVSVNGYTALMHCPLWQGVNIIAGDIGQVPIRLVRNEFDEQRQHNAWQLLRVRPNALQTPSVWKETMIQWALVWGNGVSWIPRAGTQITDMIPLRPDCLWPELLAFDGQQILLYHYWSPTSGREFTFFPHEVLHIQGLTGDGVWGIPLHQIARNTIGHGLALEKHGNRSFSNGARPSGVLKHPSKMTPEARSNLREEWNALHAGPDKSGTIAILWEGMEFQAMAMTNIDAQWLEAKKLNRIDVASLLNLPAHKLNALEDSSVRSNLEEQNEVYKQMTLTRWSNRMDEEFRRKLLRVSEWQSDEFRFIFDWDTFLRADIDTLTTVGDRCVKAEIMNRNEARRMLGLKPYEGGEKFGSPAINPQPDAKPPSADDDKKSPEPTKNRLTSVANAHQELLYDHILHLIEREESSLRQAASGARNFVKWLDGFYLGCDGQEPEIGRLFDAVCGTSIRACLATGLDVRGVQPAVASYAKTRHKQCMETCSHATRDELPAAINKLSNSDAALVAQGLLATVLGLEHEMNGAAAH